MSPSDSQPPGRDFAVAPAHPDLTDLARRQLVPVGVEHPHLAEDGAPDRAPALEPFAARDDGEGLRLRSSVELEDALGAQPVDPGFLEPDGARGGHVKHHAKARKVVSRALGLGEPPDAVHHRRHRVHPVDLVLLDESEGDRRVESRHDHEMVAAQQREHRGHERAIVVKGPGHQVRAVLRHPQHGREPRDSLPRGRLCGDDELRPPRASPGGRRLE